MLVNRHNKSLAERREEGSARGGAPLHRTGAAWFLTNPEIKAALFSYRNPKGPLLRGPLVDRYSLNVLENCSLVKVSGVGVTPVSKKQTPPNDRPTACTFCVALVKAAATSGSVAGLPSQSDHSAGTNMSAVMRFGPWFPLSRSRNTGFDHQNA